MSSHAHTYCKTLAALPAADAINAIHQALMQFNAVERGVENVDNRPVIAELTRLLAVAGHLGYDAVPTADQSPAEEPSRYFYTYKLPFRHNTKLTYWRAKDSDEASGLALSLYRTIEFHIEETDKTSYLVTSEGQRGN